MSERIGGLMYNVRMDLSDFDKGLKKMRYEIANTQKELAAFSANFAKKITAPLTALAAVSVYAYGEQEVAQRKLASALDAAGESAAALMPQFNALATELQQLTVVGDEASLGAMQMGVSLGITSDQLDAFTKATVGVSRAMGTDLNSAARLVAQGMQGQYATLSRMIPALKGVKDEQKKAAIVAEFFAKSFGVALGETQSLFGALTTMKNAVGDAAEEIGAVLAPAVIAISKRIKAASEWFNGLSKETKTFIVSLGVMAATLPALAGAFVVLAKAVTAVKTAMTLLQIATVKTGFGALIVAAGILTYGIMSLCGAFEDEEDAAEDVSAETERLKSQLQAVAQTQTELKAETEAADAALKSQAETSQKLREEMDGLSASLFSADAELFEAVHANDALNQTYDQQIKNLDNLIALYKARVVEGKASLEQLRGENAELKEQTAQTQILTENEKALAQFIRKKSELQKKENERVQKLKDDTAQLAKDEAKRADEKAREQSHARAEFEMEQSIEWLKRNGYQLDAKRLEMQKTANKLMKDYGYSWEQALAIAQQLNAEMDKSSKSGGYSDQQIAKAREFLKKTASGKVAASSDSIEDANAILAGDTSHELKSNQFKQSRSGRKSNEEKAQEAAGTLGSTIPPSNAATPAGANGSAPNANSGTGAAANEKSGALSEMLANLAETVQTLVGKLDALFPVAV